MLVGNTDPERTEVSLQNHKEQKKVPYLDKLPKTLSEYCTRKKKPRVNQNFKKYLKEKYILKSMLEIIVAH